MRSVARATNLRRPWSVQLTSTLATSLHDALQAVSILPDRGGKQQQQQLNRKSVTRTGCQSGREKSVARATNLRRSWSVQLTSKLTTSLRDALQAVSILPDRGGKQQQQQLSRKVSARRAVSQEER